jgi:hypothetical protein
LQFAVNVLRLLDREGVPEASLPVRSGVGAEALGPALRILQDSGFIERGSGRGKRVRLTDKGAAEQRLYLTLPDKLEARLGFAVLRPGLEALLIPDAPLWPRIDLPPESWRSKVPRPEVLPHHPHPRQGGHPDGV